MSETKIDPDKALLALGKYGKYQLRIWFLANLPSVYLALQMLSMAFVNGKPDFYCSSESESYSASNRSWPDSKTNDTCYFTCHNNTLNSIRHCGTGNTKFVYDDSFGTTIVTEWNLVCQKNFYSEFVGSIYMFGVMLGAIGITQISDKFGRRWTFLICNWLFAVVGLCLAFTDSYASFALTRFLSGVLNAGVAMVGFVISCEVVPTSWRASSTLLGFCAWFVGYVTLGVVAMFVRDWRRLTIITALPAFVSFTYYWFVPESLRWLIVSGKDEEVEKWIATAAECNGVTVDVEQLREKEDKESMANARKPETRNIFNICRSKVLASQAVVMCYIWLCNAFVYYGLSLFSTRLSGDRYVNFILSGLVELPAYFTAVFALEKCGRRATTFIFHALAGVALFALIFVPAQTGSGVDLSPLAVALSLIGKFAISCTFLAVSLFTAELYPTAIRTVGCGLSSTAARVGAILAPYVALLADLNPSLPPTIFGIMSLLAAILAGCFPETKGIELYNDIDEVQAGPLQRIIFGRPKSVNRRAAEERAKDSKDVENLPLND